MSPSDRTSPSRKLLAMMRNVPPDLKALLALVGIGGITAMATIGYKLNSDPEVSKKHEGICCYFSNANSNRYINKNARFVENYSECQIVSTDGNQKNLNCFVLINPLYSQI
ncbi:hypothetical protein SJAG_06392 [Schizosaccharomyces japonicus yFS275]|uniref:Uncharacterized protein n=1 Tax=Schizosaccharomyces japonicus (strain yFS275 / FY16936) TaxID=402676 RepID=T0S140_SCHJY|nr:hypothetical protein SJAG_06392 [Schizosaccharomyces japonicus yFS275]EQC53027.1 hypothetical protein SJAG_06392 [Schizosaccharomyces japonicus yFS275]